MWEQVARMEHMLEEERSLRQKLEADLQAAAGRDATQKSAPATSRLSSSAGQPLSPWSCGPAGTQALVVRDERGGLEAWQDVAGVLHEKRDTRSVSLPFQVHFSLQCLKAVLRPGAALRAEYPRCVRS